MNNKKLITFLVIGCILIGGSFLVFSGKKKAELPQEQVFVEEKISVINPEEIGLSLTMSSDKRNVIFAITDTKGISGIDYELSYTSKGDISRGAIGRIDIKEESKSVRKEIPLGTCSDVCHYDEGVSDIKLILKVAKTDGTTSSVEKSLEL